MLVVFLALLAPLVFGLVAANEGIAVLGGKPNGKRQARMAASPRFRNGTFHNTKPTQVMQQSVGLDVTLDFLFGGKKRLPPGTIPVLTDTRARLAEPITTGLRITWLGHSTLLLEIDGRRFLTDPVWGDRASPSRLFGPKRFHRPPLSLDELGPLDAILVSHDHYDHLCMETIRKLAPRGIPFVAPLGVGAHLEKWGVPAATITELDWWDELNFSDVRLVSTPAQHFSGRGVGDRNRTAWTSYSLLGPKHRIFFSGDTGLTEEFRDIGKKLGPFDVTMLEVGAFNEAWGSIHLGPNNAAIAHEMLQGRMLLPIHWATFDLGLHPWIEPAETLHRLAAERDIALLAPKVGEPLEPAQTRGAPWWQTLTQS